ncbi:hypothetical protein DB346_06690 [Verrucomicrobia bacterium LW23]|nr:hypothetical protein DB346_06690 [Verrucomicrobia bacterium LW23]
MARPEVRTILCIPGVWKDRTAAVQQIAKLSGGYLFAGDTLTHMESKQSIEMELCEPDERMARAFAAAGPHWRDTPEMERIATHGKVAYLVGQGGSADRAKAMMQAGAALLYAGGLGVKVESSGLAFSPAQWIRMTDNCWLGALHQAYVVYVEGGSDDADTFSCGMHNLGMPDAIVESRLSENPVELLRVFTAYLCIEAPDLRPSHTFSVEDGAPRYRVSREEDVPYPDPEDLFHNPYGMWRLKLA